MSASRCPSCFTRAVTCSTISWWDTALGFFPKALQTAAMCLLACLWITAARCLHPHSPFFHSSPSSACCFAYAHSDWQLHPFRLHFQTLLFFHVFLLFFPIFWLTSMCSVFYFSLPRRLVWLMRDAALSVSHEWEAANAHQSFIISSTKITQTNHPTNRLLSEHNLKSPRLYNLHHRIHTQLCLQRMFTQKYIKKFVFTSFTSWSSCQFGNRKKATVTPRLQVICLNSKGPAAPD